MKRLIVIISGILLGTILFGIAHKTYHIDGWNSGNYYWRMNSINIEWEIKPFYFGVVAHIESGCDATIKDN